jgi:hypothetical protein
MSTSNVKLNIFVVFHSKIYTELYTELDETEKDCITLYGVKAKCNSTMKTIYEEELPIYLPALQRNIYNEGSALYHVYTNNLYTEYDYVGFGQYDMKFNSGSIKAITQQIEKESRNTKHIFYINFFAYPFTGSFSLLIKKYNKFECGLKSYNDFFNTTYTKTDLLKNYMPVFNTFVIPKQMYEKMMSWLQYYFVEDICEDDITMYDMTIPKNIIHFGTGHMIEALVGMFLLLEVLQGAKYSKLDMVHDQQFKVVT